MSVSRISVRFLYLSANCYLCIMFYIFYYFIKNLKKELLILIFYTSFNLSYGQCPVTSPTAINGCKISAGSVQLGSSGSSGYYSWYDASTGGSYLGYGSSFNTPFISSTTTYYVAAADTNYALDFDGSNDYVALGNPAQLQITGDMTIEMWLKPDNFSARRNPYAKAYGGEGTITQETDGTLNYYYGTNGGNGAPYQGFNSTTALTLNEWNHIAIVRDLTSMQLYWYINGVLTNQTAASYATATAGSNNATIGSGYVSNYDGQIDEFRIWNTTRTQTEIRDKMCSKLPTNESGLIAYYRFDEGSGSVLSDLTANGLDGTITNGPLWTASGAAIGDNSTYIYPGSWAGQTLSLAFCGGENLTVSNMSGTPNGVHIYSVGAVPNTTVGIVGLGSNDRYFGVFKVNDATATYTATYDYTGNPHVGPGNEPTLLLFKRADNEDALWVNTGATLNTGVNTLIGTAQSTEFILGSSGNPLPIELISFEASINEDEVDLKWVTATEINNDYFTIEKSIDGISWEKVLNTNGAGNSTEILEYFETDYNPLIGISYYRLKQTDIDGEYSYSNIVPVKYEKRTIDGMINLFPNPVNIGEEVHLEFENINAPELLVVLRDIQGKEFYSKIILNIEDGKLIGIPITINIPVGVYLITATSENHFYNQKLIVK